jgi:hypothetical protein
MAKPPIQNYFTIFVRLRGKGVRHPLSLSLVYEGFAAAQ